MDVLPSLIIGVRLVGWVLIHFIWQCSLLGLLYAAVKGLLPRGEARYRLGMVALMLITVCPLLTIWHQLQVAPSGMQLLAEAVTPGVPDSSNSANVGWSLGTVIDALLPWLVIAWLLGVSTLSLQAWRQWQKIKSLVGEASHLSLWQSRVNEMVKSFGLRRHVRVLCSKVIATPTLVGWMKPVVLLPMSVVCRFPLAHIELILAHELAHLRRWDPLANLFQVILETLHFYHPVVHWISRDVRNEREICCDRLALSLNGGSRQQFAEALVELGELREQRGSLLLAASGGVLFDRVQQMVEPSFDGVRLGWQARFMAMLLVVAFVAVTVRLQWTDVQLQQRLTVSLMQFNTMLMSEKLAWEPSIRAMRVSDLVLSRAQAIRPRVANYIDAVPTHQAAILPINMTALVLSRSPVLRIVDLTSSRNDSTARAINQPIALPAAAVPTPIHIRHPVYPQGALMQGIEGRVTLEFAISADGGVGALRVIAAKPAGVFESAAEQAMYGWKYAVSPKTSSQLRYRQTMVFTLGALHTDRSKSIARPGDEIQAQVGCQIVTGTNICRLPDNVKMKKPVEIAD